MLYRDKDCLGHKLPLRSRLAYLMVFRDVDTFLSYKNPNIISIVLCVLYANSVIASLLLRVHLLQEHEFLSNFHFNIDVG